METLKYVGTGLFVIILGLIVFHIPIVAAQSRLGTITQLVQIQNDLGYKTDIELNMLEGYSFEHALYAWTHSDFVFNSGAELKRLKLEGS